MAGIALGVAALIVVLSVMNGFQKEVRDRMLSVLPHIELYIPGAAPERVLDQWQQYADAAKKNPAVKAGAPFVAAQGMLVRGQALRGVQVRGIDPATEGGVSDLPRQMVTGKLSDLKPGGFGVVLGNELADGMGVKVGDTLMMMAPQARSAPPASRRACVSSPWWACSLPATTNTIPRWPSSTTRTPPACSATAGRRATARGRHAEGARGGRRAGQVLPPYMMASDWSRNNRTWFAAVKTEKRMMFLILALIVAVAAFNLLSSLVMAVRTSNPTSPSCARWAPGRAKWRASSWCRAR